MIASIDSSQEGTAVSHSTQRDGGGGQIRDMDMVQTTIQFNNCCVDGRRWYLLNCSVRVD